MRPSHFLSALGFFPSNTWQLVLVGALLGHAVAACGTEDATIESRPIDQPKPEERDASTTPQDAADANTAVESSLPDTSADTLQDRHETGPDLQSDVPTLTETAPDVQPDLPVTDSPPVDVATDDVVDAQQDVAQPDAGPDIDSATPDVVTDVQSDPVSEPTPDASGQVRVRIVAANLTSGNGQNYDPGHGIRILEGLHADVILLQEFNYLDNSDSDIRNFVTQVCGDGCSFVRGASGSIPNGIVSRYPTLAGGDWEDPNVSNRNFVWAKIDIPGPADLLAVSVHLLTTGSQQRNAQAKTLISYLAREAPNGSAVVLGGDFNTDSRSEACIDTLSARFVTAGPYPADRSGNDNTNKSRAKPLDWVVASPTLDTLEAPVTIGSQHFNNGLVFDTRVYTPLADVAPARESDSDASGMQHMAVVRDFLVPGP